MFGIGAPELVLILVLALIFIGPQKLPEMARMFGRTYRDFQRSMDEVKGEFAEASAAVKHTGEGAAVSPSTPDTGNREGFVDGTAKGPNSVFPPD